MGRSDGVLVGASILAGILLGPPAAIVAPTTCLLVQFLAGQLAVGRVVICALLAVMGAVRAHSATADPNESVGFVDAGSDAAVGRVRSMPKANRSGQQFLFEVERTSRAGQWKEARFFALVTATDRAVNVDDVIWVAWSADRPSDLPPGYLSYVTSKGADTAAYAFAVEVIEPGDSYLRPLVDARQTMTSALRTASPGDPGALLAGLVTGDDSGLGQDADAAFLATGTSHITAVSGSNLALVAGIWGALGTAGRWRRRWWLQAGLIGSVWAYAAMVGLEPPALRAAIVASMTALSVRVGRRPDPLTLVLLAAAAMAIIAPMTARSLSFQLSVASSAALVSCLPRRADAGTWAWVHGTVTGVVAAHFATLPLVVATFGSWSPLSIPANLAILPLVPPTFGLAFVAGIVGPIWPALGGFLGMVAGIGAATIIGIVSALARLAEPISLVPESALSLVLIGLVSLTIIGLLSGDARRWSEELSDARPALRMSLPLLSLSVAGGALVFLAIVHGL